MGGVAARGEGGQRNEGNPMTSNIDFNITGPLAEVSGGDVWLTRWILTSSELREVPNHRRNLQQHTAATRGHWGGGGLRSLFT